MTKKGEYQPQTFLTSTDAAKKLGISRQRLEKLVLDGFVSKRLSDGRYPFPRVEKQFEEYAAQRQERIVYSGGNPDAEFAKAMKKAGNPPAQGLDELSEGEEQPVIDFNNLSIGEQIINQIQNRIKGAEGTSYQWSRSLNEAIKARSAMLSLLEQEGKTLQREEVESWLYNISRHNRDIWMNWPQLVASEIAEELGCDSRMLYDLLMKLVRENLERIATMPVEFEGHSASSVSEGPEAPDNSAA